MEKAFQKIVWGILFVAFMQAQPPALQNLGNSCYVNALLQNFFNLSDFNRLLLSNEASELFKNNHFVMAYKDLVQEQLNNMTQRKVSVGDFTHGLQHFYSFVGDCFRCGYKEGLYCSQALSMEQQDATELYIKFMEQIATNNSCYALFIHTSAKEIRCDGHVVFDGDVQHKIVWLVPVARYEYNDGSLITLPYMILHDAITASLKSYPLEGYKLNNVVQKNCQQSIKITALSDYCVFVLERFALGDKLSTQCAIPLTVDLGAYRLGAFSENYELIGVVLHTGSLDSGHYYAYIKDQYDPLHLWYRCDDAVITKIGTELSAVAQRDINQNSYMLFYKKITPKVVYFIDQLAHECAFLEQFYTA